MTASNVPVDLGYTVASSPIPDPGSSNFVLSTTSGTPRNNYSGWVGMSLTVGPVSLDLSSLGRIVVAGNSGSHAGATPGSIVYGALPSPLTLNANSTYYILSQEAQGGDFLVRPRYYYANFRRCRADCARIWQQFAFRDNARTGWSYVRAGGLQVHRFQVEDLRELVSI